MISLELLNNFVLIVFMNGDKHISDFSSLFKKLFHKYGPLVEIANVEVRILFFGT